MLIYFSRGDQPVHVAARVSISCSLVESNPLSTSIFFLVQAGHLSILKLLLARGVELEAK